MRSRTSLFRSLSLGIGVLQSGRSAPPPAARTLRRTRSFRERSGSLPPFVPVEAPLGELPGLRRRIGAGRHVPVDRRLVARKPRATLLHDRLIHWAIATA